MYDDLTCQFKLFVTNGPVFEEHVNLEEFWEKKIVEEFLEYAKIRDLAEEEDNHVQSMYNDWVINREEMEEVGDDLVYTIDNVSYSYENAMHRDRTVHIDESSYYEDGSIESNPPK
jgi:hypothetical protein